MGDKRIKKASQKKELKSRGMVTIPYVKGLREAFSRILKTYRICTAVKPHITLRNLLVHPKDRIKLGHMLHVRGWVTPKNFYFRGFGAAVNHHSVAASYRLNFTVT